MGLPPPDIEAVVGRLKLSLSTKILAYPSETPPRRPYMPLENIKRLAMLVILITKMDDRGVMCIL